MVFLCQLKDEYGVNFGFLLLGENAIKNFNF